MIYSASSKTYQSKNVNQKQNLNIIDVYVLSLTIKYIFDLKNIEK
jgi:hypothetical protein